ncbi:S-layer protein domain-containing protein [Methanolapillus africanus]
MKHLLVALVVLLALAGTASAATSVDVRSTILDYQLAVYNYDTTVPGFVAPGAGNAWGIDASNWAGLYYDLDNNRSTETLVIQKTAKNNEVNISYETHPVFVQYDYTGWGNYTEGPANALTVDAKYGYAIIGFFAEPYVALSKANTSDPDANDPAGTLAQQGVKANKIAPLVQDSNDKYTLTTGQSLDLGNGYSLVASQIDVNGNKAYLELFKDGKSVDTAIINTNTTNNTTKTWVLDKDALGEKDLQFFRVQINQVFQGTSSSLVEIKGIWLADIDQAFEVKSDVDYGKFEADAIGADKLTYNANNTTLSADMSTDLGRGIVLKTEKDYDGTAGDAKFYFVKTYTTPGKYEIRSTVNAYNVIATYDYDFTNFAAFYYNVDADVSTENLSAEFLGTDGKILEGDLIYTTTPDQVGYEYSNWSSSDYWVMGLFGESYVPFNILKNSSEDATLKADKMSKLILDSNDKYTLSTGQSLDLGNGYTVVANQIDVNGNKVYLEFFKDGKSVDTAIINTDTDDEDAKTWFYTVTLLNEKDVQVMRLHVSQVFQGTESSLVEIKGIWLMDASTAKELKTDDNFGSFDFDGVVGNAPAVLTFTSNKDITVSQDTNTNLVNNFWLRSADSDTYKNFYFYVLAEVDGSGPTPDNNTSNDTPVTPPSNDTPSNDTPKPNDSNQTPTPEPEPESFWSKYMWYIIAIVVIIIIAAAGGYYYFKVYKPKNS